MSSFLAETAGVTLHLVSFVQLHGVTLRLVLFAQLFPENAEEYVDYLKSINRLDEAALKLAEILNMVSIAVCTWLCVSVT